MNKRRILVWIWCGLLTWTICDIASEEMKRRSEIIALCAYAELGERKPKLSEPAPAAQAAIRWIAATAGMSSHGLDIYSADDVPGVAFAAVRDNKRIIVYDAKRFQWGEQSAVWADACTTAHEVGHHLGSHMLTATEPHDKEIEADRFAGYACSIMGASLAQALAFTDQMPEADSDTHPGKAKRRAAVTEGWTHGDTLKRTGRLGSSSQGLTP